MNGIRATPAGSEMNVRMIGSMRVKKTVASPWRSNQRSAPSQVLGLDVELAAVLLEDVDAAVVADAVRDPRPDEVRERADERHGDERCTRPRETLKPANSIVASLGIGMHALSSSMSTKTPGRPEVADDVGRELDDRVRDGGDDEDEHAPQATDGRRAGALPCRRTSR